MKVDLQEMRWEHNELAIDTCIYVCDRIIEGKFDNCWDYLEEEIDDAMIYYSRCWEYLEKTGQTDFKEAIGNGCETLTQIACYYLREEVYEILGKFTHFDDLYFNEEDENDE